MRSGLFIAGVPRRRPPSPAPRERGPGGEGSLQGQLVLAGHRHLPLEPGLDERIEVAVEDAVGVADLGAGAVVLDQAVGLQHVAADLAPPGDLLLLPLALGLLGAALLHLAVVEAAALVLHPQRYVLG